MIKSMTGFGRSICELPSKNAIIEIKSLNSKQLDLSVKMPYLYKEKEFDVRNIVAEKMQRGKVDFSIYFEHKTVEVTKEINKPIALAYYNQIKNLAIECGDSTENILPLVLRIPEVFNANTEIQKLDAAEWSLVMSGISDAISQLESFRITEGKALENDLLANMKTILEKKIAIEPFEKERIVKYRQRLMTFLEENVGKENIDNNRFEQELIYMLEKLDINEEKVRLSQHCKYFEETILTEDQPGRKLGFITQEIGREINTIGSKSNDAEMQKLVVQMKDELERVKEQVLNVL
jgi:uncharacterized protein (TIGR00255 family)